MSVDSNVNKVLFFYTHPNTIIQLSHKSILSDLISIGVFHNLRSIVEDVDNISQCDRDHGVAVDNEFRILKTQKFWIQFSTMVTKVNMSSYHPSADIVVYPSNK